MQYAQLYGTLVLDRLDQAGLGNHLFVYAHMLSFAMAHKIRLLNPSFREYADYFEAGTAGHLGGWRPRWSPVPLRRQVAQAEGLCRDVVESSGGWADGRRRRVLDIGWDRFLPLDDPGFLALAARRGTLVCQGFQYRDEPNFSGYASAVRAEFRLAEPYRLNVSRVLQEARRGSDVLVGVHVRGGDYARHLGGRYLYPVARYADMMRHVAGLIPGRRVRFLVTSGEQPDPALFQGLDVCFSTGQRIEDLYAQAGCDYLFGPPSTYSMWASYWGGARLYRMADPDKLPSLGDFNVFGVHTRPLRSLSLGRQSR